MRSLSGYVYILSNPAFKDDIFKIGMTTRTPKDRALEIYTNATGVPMQFEISYARAVANCKAAEEEIHSILSNARINQNREFFWLPLQQAKNAFEAVCEQIDLKCRDAQPIGKKVVIDHIPSIRKSVSKAHVEERARATSLREAPKINPPLKSNDTVDSFDLEIQKRISEINFSNRNLQAIQPKSNPRKNWSENKVALAIFVSVLISGYIVSLGFLMHFASHWGGWGSLAFFAWAIIFPWTWGTCLGWLYDRFIEASLHDSGSD